MTITTATRNDAQNIAAIISEANQPVAHAFGITIENNPKHPSFYTAQWVLSDFDRGEEYFMAHHNDNNSQEKADNTTPIACVAFEHPRPNVAYLNRLSVLPNHQHQGVGEALVQHIINYADSKNIQRISIGIIAEHTALKHWYVKLGFQIGETKRFAHLPFSVLYMSLYL